MRKSDNRLINLLNRKHNEGYELLYRNYYASLCNFCFRFLKNKEEAEDLVQDIFYKLWKKNISFYSEQSLTSFLYISARNASLNRINKKAKFLNSDTFKDELNELKDERTIQQIIIEEEYYRQFYTVINKLTPERRKVILMSMEGLTNKEIALKAGISVNTVKTLKLKAYKFLRSNLNPIIHFDLNT